MRILSKTFVVDLALAGLLFGATAFAPDMAHAQAAGGADSFLQDIFCRAINLVQGSTAQALATIAIIIVGIGALLG
ncbi:MAG: TrbC/VirB2 family protein, partial [Alphaproteobacteria bacterium]|nr:TrbC/VirB2 family protein [Alphaproteobacteria bacterium]